LVSGWQAAVMLVVQEPDLAVGEARRFLYVDFLLFQFFWNYLP
jgi:hypothetical protein